MGRIIAKKIRGMNWMAKVSLILTFTMFLSIFLFAPDEAAAANISSAATGPWNTGATWVGGVVPGAADNVTIANGHTVTIAAAPTNPTISLLTIATGTLATGVTFSGAFALTVTNAVTINVPTLAVTKQIAVGTGTLTAGSIMITGGNVASYISRVTVSTGTVNITGAGALTFGAGTIAANQVFSFSGAGTLNIGGNVAGTVGTFTTFAGSTVNFNGGAQILAPFAITFNNLTLSGSGAKTMTLVTVSGILSREGTATASAAPTWSGTAYTLQYKGTAAQTTGPEFTTPFAGTGGVKIENASGVTLNAAKSVGANPLTIGSAVSGSLFDDGGFQLTATGTLNLTSGTMRLGGAAATTFPAFATRNMGAGTTVEYEATVAQTVAVIAYRNLTLSGSLAKTGAVTTVNENLTLSGTATYTTSAALTIGGNLTVGNGTTLTVGAFLITVTGTTTVGSGTSGILAHSSATGVKTYTGLVTINSGGQWTNAGNSAINFRGGLTNNGTFSAGTVIYTFNTNNQAIGGTSATTIPSVTVTTITLTNNLTGTGLTVGTALIGTGGLTQGTTATLNIGGTSTITTLTATAAGNTVNYNAAGNQAACKVTAYNNLTLSGSGIKTFANFTAPSSVNGILSIEGTATVVATTGAVTYGANATLQYKTTDVRTVTLEEWITPFAATGGVIIANTAGSITMNDAKVFNNSVPLTINSGATLAVTGGVALTLGGNFVNNGGTFTAGSSAITISGNWTNTGTFNAGTSTVTFNGTGNQSISGSNTWYNLSITATAAKRTVKFASGATQTIAAGGSLNLQGFSAAQPLTLAPSSATTAWLLNNISAIAPSISNVAVSFSTASGLIDASTGGNSDAGNNTNWKFAGGSIVSCVGCHGYGAFPDGAARNNPDGAFLGSHNEHVVRYSNACSVCHVAPATETNADFKHRNSTITMASPINGDTGAAYTKGASWAQTNSPSAFTGCTNTYCHSNGTSVITLSIPANTSATWGGTATCTSCHGVGGGDDGRPNYANNSPKRNTHGDGASYGVTHKAAACPTCHAGVSGSAGAYTVDPATHNDGTYNLQSSMTYTLATGNCATAGGCHGSANWGGSLPCLDCHSDITDDGIGPTRRAMSTEVTTFTWSHKKTAAAWNSFDCGVCHMEGDPLTGLTTALHKNNLLEFRDPDTGTTIEGVTFAGTPGSYTSTGSATSAAVFARNTNLNTLEPFAQAVQVNLCLKCHDVGGAASALARVPGGTAAKPFGTTGGTVLNISAHFATGNATYHPVSGKQNNSYCNAYTMSAPWNFAKTPPNITSWGYLMTCWDCHDSSAAPRTIGGAVASVTAHGNAVTLRAAYDSVNGQATSLCVVCHKTSVYWTNTTHAVVGFSALNGDPAEWPGHHGVAEPYNGCTVCHGTTVYNGALPGRPTKAINAHGFNTIADGVTTTWPSGARPYSFMRCSNQMSTWNPTGGLCDNGTSMCGRSETGVYTPGGTY